MKILSISNDYLSSKGRTNFTGEIHSMADAMRELDRLQRKYANSNGDTCEGNYSTKLEKEVAESSAAASRGIAAMSEYDKLLRAIELLPPDLPSIKQAKSPVQCSRPASIPASLPKFLEKFTTETLSECRLYKVFNFSRVLSLLPSFTKTISYSFTFSGSAANAFTVAS